MGPEILKNKQLPFYWYDNFIAFSWNDKRQKLKSTPSLKFLFPHQSVDFSIKEISSWLRKHVYSLNNCSLLGDSTFQQNFLKSKLSDTISIQIFSYIWVIYFMIVIGNDVFCESWMNIKSLSEVINYKNTKLDNESFNCTSLFYIWSLYPVDRILANLQMLSCSASALLSIIELWLLKNEIKSHLFTT